MSLDCLVFPRHCKLQENAMAHRPHACQPHHLRFGNSCFKLPRSSGSCVLACYNPGLYGGDESSSKVPSLSPRVSQRHYFRSPRVSQRDTGYGAFGEDYEDDHEIETGIHWSSLSNDEFLAQLANLRLSRPGFCPSMLCEEEWMEFCGKRFTVISKCAEEVSKMIGNTDLITPLLEYRKFQRGEEAPLYEKQRKGKRLLADVFCIDDLPHFMEVTKESLKLKERSQLCVYVAQLGVPEFRDLAIAVLKLLDQPFVFRVGATTYTEVAYVMMRANTKLPGLWIQRSWFTRGSLQVQVWVASSLKQSLVAVKKMFRLENVKMIKDLLGWTTAILKEKIKELKEANANVAVNRATREAAVERLYKEMLDVCILADYEGGRQSHHEDFQFML